MYIYIYYVCICVCVCVYIHTYICNGRFQFLLDKMGLTLENLTVTLTDMQDDYHEALKKDKVCVHDAHTHTHIHT